jgi:hypothetical protein
MGNDTYKRIVQMNNKVLRRPKFLSPTSISQYYERPMEFYIQRLLPVPPPKEPQTRPMAVGSSFDCFVKNDLYKQFIGDPTGTDYDLNKILGEQLEVPEDRDWAIKNGAFVFHQYKKSGSLASLSMDLGKAVMDSIKMEKTVTRTIRGVPLLGKPDLSFQTTCPSREDGGPEHLATFILDWKVNGYCSRGNTSPTKGYVCCRSMDGKSAIHKDAILGNVCGITINMAQHLESINKSWAAQTVTYAWILGAPVGSEIYCGIDQLACRRFEDPVDLENSYPEIRVASYRMGVSEAFQRELMEKYINLWSIMSMDDEGLRKRFFRTETCQDDEGSLKECLMLESGDPKEQFFARMAR